MTPTVSVVVATIGRPTLARAVRSALEQSRPIHEVIVVADTEQSVTLPDDGRITLLHTPCRSGPALTRQLGIDAARGAVIALLDDDDEWDRQKLERQLAAVPAADETNWIASSRVTVVGPGSRRRTWPRRLIEPGQSIADYLFRFDDLAVGGALLQTSTLCFPVGLARRVRWADHVDAIQDEPSWLIDVQRTVPDLRVIQLPDVLSTYDVSNVSVSRSPLDRTDDYIAWGLNYLSAESPRILGDYLCTRPVSAAVSARSLRGVWHSIRAALRYGRPGLHALAYSNLNAARILLRALGSTVRK